MVPHEIEPTKGVGCAPHDAAGEVVLAQIAYQAKRAAARGGNFADDGIDARLIDVDDTDRRTFPGETERARAPHPGSCRRDDADLAVEPHGFLSFVRPLCPSSAREVPGGA